jgi:uncharacterized membrane protein YhaH (DUF805 family)
MASAKQEDVFAGIILGGAMNFTDAIKFVLILNYANFGDRSGLREFWFFALLNLLVVVAFWIITSIVSALSFLVMIYGLAVAIPAIALAVRRLHDTGKPGWWVLIAVTIIGLVPLIYWFAQPSEPNDNQYGPQPAA